MKRFNEPQSHHDLSWLNHNCRDGSHGITPPKTLQKQQILNESHLSQHQNINYYFQDEESQSSDHLPGNEENHFWENPLFVDSSGESMSALYGPKDVDEFDLADYLDRENQQIQDFEDAIDDEKEVQNIEDMQEVMLDENEFSKGSNQTNRLILNQTQSGLNDKIGQSEERTARYEEKSNRDNPCQSRTSREEQKEASSGKMIDGDGDNNVLWTVSKEPNLELLKKLDEKKTSRPADLVKDKYHWFNTSYQSLILRRGRDREKNVTGKGQSKQTLNLAASHGENERPRSPLQERAREKEGGVQEPMMKESGTEIRHFSSFAKMERDSGNIRDPNNECDPSALHDGRTVGKSELGRDKINEPLGSDKKFTGISSDEEIIWESCAPMNARTLPQKNLSVEQKTPKAELCQKRDEKIFGIQSKNCQSLPALQSKHDIKCDSSNLVQLHDPQSVVGNVNKKRDIDEGKCGSNKSSDAICDDRVQVTECWLPLQEQTLRFDVQCDLGDQSQQSAHHRVQRSKESDKGKFQVSFQIKNRGLNTKIPRRAQKSSTDGSAPGNSNATWVPLSERIFQVHEEAEDRFDEQALERVKQHLENEIRYEERRENALKRAIEDPRQLVAMQKKFKMNNSANVKDTKILKHYFCGNEITQKTSVVRRDEKSRERERNERRKRSRSRSRHRRDSSSEDLSRRSRTRTRRHRYSPGPRYRRSRTRSRRRRNSSDDRYRRSRTKSRYRRDSSDDRFINRTRSRYRGDFSNDRLSRRRHRSYSRNRTSSRDRSYTRRSRIGRLRRSRDTLTPITLSELRDDSHSRLKQRREPGPTTSPSSKSSRSSVSRQTTSVNGKEVRYLSGSPIRCDSSSTDADPTEDSSSIADQPHVQIVAYSPSHADSIDLEASRFEFLDSPECEEESQLIAERNKTKSHPDTSLPVLQSKCSSQNPTTKEANASSRTEKGLEQTKGAVEDLDAVGTHLNAKCVLNIAGDCPVRTKKNLRCSGEFPTVCLENLDCVKEVDVENQHTVKIDRMRQLALLLILLKREMREGIRLSVTPQISETNDLLESSFSFQRKNPETGKLEVDMFSVKYLVSDGNGRALNVNYEMLFSECLNIEKLCKSFNAQTDIISVQNGEVKKFTILTNLGLHSIDLKSKGLNVIQGTAKNRKSLFVSKNCEIFHKFPNQVLLRLANVLVRAIDEPEPVNFTPFLKTYHLALIRENIVKIEITGRKKKSDCLGIFHQDFIQNRNLSRSAKELRHHVLSLLQKESFPDDLKMNLPEAFGREFVNAYSSLSVKVNLDGLDNPATEFFDCIEFEKYSNDIEKVILEETGIEFKHLEIESVQMALEDCLCILIESEDDPIDDWLDVVKMVMSQQLIIHNHLVQSQIEVEFRKHDMLSKLEHRLFGLSSSRKLTIQTDHAFLISSMVEQVVNQYLKVSRDSYCCMKIKLENSPNLISHIHNLVRSPSANVFVIDCSDESLNVENMRTIFSSLMEELDSLPAELMKKMVIVGPQRTLPRILKNVVNDFLTCVPEGIEILSETSQDKLLQHCDIKVRSKNIKLRDLLSRENIMSLLSNPRFLTQLLTSKVIVENIVPALPQYDRDTHIPRHISLQVIIDTNILKEAISDVFIIQGISKKILEDLSGTNEAVHRIDEISKDNHDARLIALEKDLPLDFEKIVEGNPRNIHLLYYKNGYLIWLLSIGSISNLVPHKLQNIPDSLDSSFFFNNFIRKRSKPRIFIISGESGAGKSSYIQALASSTVHTASCIWFLKINLSREYFKNCGETSFGDLESTVTHIKERLQCSEFLQNLFFVCALGKSALRITLFFDGFDELSSDLLECASQMILQLQTSFIENIYVTVRPGINKQHLELKLCIFSHHLDPLTQDEECQLLISFWKKKLQKSKNKINQCSLEDFAEKLLNIFHPIFQRGDFGMNGDLASYPLYLKMLAEIHKNCSEDKLNDPDLINNIYEFYKTHVLNTYPRIFYREIVYKKSLQRLLPVSVFESLEIDGDETDVTNFELPDELCHVTFAEYAVVEWLKTQVASQDYELVRILQCIDSIMDSTSPVFSNSVKSVFSNLEDYHSICSFVNLETASDRALFLQTLAKSESEDSASIHSSSTTDDETSASSVEDDCVESVKPELQDLDAEKLPEHDKSESHPREISESVEMVDKVVEVENDRVKFLKPEPQEPEYQELPEHEEFKSLSHKNSEPVEVVAERVGIKSVVQPAGDAANVDVVYDMVLAGDDLSVLGADFLRQLSYHIARKLAKLPPLEKSKLHIIAEKLFLVVPEMGFDAADRETLYPRILPYFFANGQLEVVQCLMDVVKSQKEKNKLLQEKFEGKSLLDYVNDSTTLTDDLARRDIIKYLLEEIGLEMKDKDKLFVHSVLNAAIKVNHPKTFKYFVGQYPGGYMGFLESSLKSDDFDVVNFLIYYDQEMKACKIRDSILHTAVRLNAEIKMIEFIINKSSVDVTNNLRETPLCVAVKSKADISVVKYFVSLGANVNAEDEEGLCPWCYILVENSGYSNREQDELMRCLISSKQELIIPPPRNLDYDYDRKRLGIIRKYEYFKNPSKYNLNYQDDGTPRVHSIIKSNKIEDWNWGKFLVAHGADVRLKDSFGKTPLHVAIEYSREEWIEFLLHHDAVFDEVDNDGISPLQLLVNLSNDAANQSDSRSLWKCLMDWCDGAGRTLLHVAADTNNIFATKKIINIDKLRDSEDLPLNYDARDFSGDAPIHLAVLKDHDFVVELLISGGANYEIRDYSRRTPLMIAKELCPFSLSTIFLESIDELFRLVKCDRAENIKRVQELVEENHNIVHARDSDGMTALHWVVQFNDNASIVKCLIEKNDSVVNAVDLNKRTPLYYAVLKNHLECAKVLREAGAVDNVLDEDGDQPSIETIITIT